MGLLLAPYNNAMRLGQGFNSFTHEICVNDAVVVSPQQAENVLTNDGNTMRLTALVAGNPSAWTKQDEIIIDNSHFEEAAASREEILKERQASNEESKARSLSNNQPTHPQPQVGAEDTGTKPASASLPDKTLTEATDSAATETPNTATSIHSETKDVEALAVAQPAAGESTEQSGEPRKPQESDTPQESAGEAQVIDSEASKALEAADSTTPSATQDASSTASNVASTDLEPKFVEDVKASTVQGVSAEAAQLSKDSPTKPADTKEQSTAGKVAGEATAIAQQPLSESTAQLEAKKQEEIRRAEREKQLKDKELARVNHRKDRQPALRQAATATKFKVDLDLDKMTKQHKAWLMPEPAKKAGKVGQQTKIFDIKNSSGVSQTVIFQSRFVEKLSEITNDMGVSAALSVKKGSVGGAGRASYIDSDKFKKSDLNYYISVKVVNQSINFKDALEFNNLPNVADEDFRDVFGDCFISGFLEGGELNALISMNILNKAKFNDIKAEGSVTLGLDKVNIEADGAFKQAKANLDLNTETTIQVSWIGGGIIKPPEEAWTIDSLARAATRFPDNVAYSPQRTHAVLTKYETLRSFHALKPVGATELDYKNAALYTSELMDTFMSYKALYSRLSTQIGDVQRGQIKFSAEKRPDQVQLSEAIKERAVAHLEELSDAEKKALIGVFPASIDGLDDARGAVRDQMNMIVERVDSIAKDPAQLSGENQQEKFLPVFAFESLLPTTQSVFRTSKRQAPITGEKLYPGDENAQQSDRSNSTAFKICPVRTPGPSKGEIQNAGEEDPAKNKATSGSLRGLEDQKPLKLRDEEIKSLEKYLSSRDEGIMTQIQLTPPLGSEILNIAPGTSFTALDFVNTTLILEYVAATLKDGVVTGLVCDYANGMSWKRGFNDPATPNKLELLDDERITSAIITVGSEAGISSHESVLALKLVTNSGRSLHIEGQAKRTGVGRRVVANRAFYDVRSVTFESPLERGYLVGFWGRSTEQGNPVGLFRLGVVWCNVNAVDRKPTEDTKQNEALEHDKVNEKHVDDYDKILREYKELKNKKEELDKKFEAQKAQHERDVSDMKARYETKLEDQAKDNQISSDKKDKTIRILSAEKQDLTSEKTVLKGMLDKTLSELEEKVAYQHLSSGAMMEATILDWEPNVAAGLTYIHHRYADGSMRVNASPRSLSSGFDVPVSRVAARLDVNFLAYPKSRYGIEAHILDFQSISETQPGSRTVMFNCVYIKPVVVVTFCALEVGKQTHLRVRCQAKNVTGRTADISVETWDKATIDKASVSVFVYEETEETIRSGRVLGPDWDTFLHSPGKQWSISGKREFARPLKRQPRYAFTGFCHINTELSTDVRIRNEVLRVTHKEIGFKISTWEDQCLFGLDCAFIVVL